MRQPEVAGEVLPASYPTAELDLLQMSRSHSEGARLDRGCSWFQNLTDGFMEASRKAAPAVLPWDRTGQRGTLRNPQGRKLISRTSLRLHTRRGAGSQAAGLAWPSQGGLWLHHSGDAGRVPWGHPRMRGRRGAPRFSPGTTFCARGEPSGALAQVCRGSCGGRAAARPAPWLPASATAAAAATL